MEQRVSLITLGARVLEPATDVFWGRHDGYFAGPAGHIEEATYTPFSPLSDTGAFHRNGFG